MNAITRSEQLTLQSHDEENCNTSANPSLNDVIEARMSRRSVFKAGLGSAGTAVLGSFGLAGCSSGNDGGTGVAQPPAPAASLDFKAGFKAGFKDEASRTAKVPGLGSREGLYAVGGQGQPEAGVAVA